MTESFATFLEGTESLYAKYRYKDYSVQFWPWIDDDRNDQPGGFKSFTLLHDIVGVSQGCKTENKSEAQYKKVQISKNIHLRRKRH